MRLTEIKTTSKTSVDANRAILEAAKDMSWLDTVNAGLLYVVPEMLVGVVRSMHDLAFESGRRFEMDRLLANWIDALGGLVEFDEEPTTEVER
jgi:hypothetical protein